MAKQKTIPELQAEIADNECQLVQLQHKQQQLEIVSPTTKRENGASGRTGSSPVVQPSRVLHRWQRS